MSGRDNQHVANCGECVCESNDSLGMNAVIVGDQYLRHKSVCKNEKAQDEASRLGPAYLHHVVGITLRRVSVSGLSCWVWILIGTTGFEPATSSTPRKRATRLRHVPLT